MLRKLEYQDRVLNAFDAYLAALKIEKTRSDTVAHLAADNPDLGLEIPDFVAKTWTKLAQSGALPPSRAAIPYSQRHDGVGRPVPNVVLKVPTGGGKTFLATQALSRVFGQYLNTNTGFVLWIVPNEAIYAQTLRHLSDRQHPYRQALDRSAAGRVRIMEKAERLDTRDIESQLCVMLLMLQAANRETNETLKMFQDRGDVHGFCPPEGDQAAHGTLIKLTPNLDHYGGFLPMVKDSLGNALRIIRPVVVMDEGHKATSDLAYRTLYGFNPCFVLELTATPKDIQPRGGRVPQPGRYANVLVEISGKELDREGMIKMPLNLDPRQSSDWRMTLEAAVEKLSELDQKAVKFQAETNRYIRPIMLIQVERTGADQRAGGHIHAKDVKDWLKIAGFDDAEIAIKTAETNDLNQPENLDLLSPTNRLRAIITKSALQEGWDCPFAYVLCSLAASSNLNAMKQLVGRIMRQPGAEKTEVAALDECHVITHHAATADVVAAVKSGLEEDGLGDLVLSISASEPGAGLKTTRSIPRRPNFVSTEIYLPKVLLVDGAEVRDLDYETDVLSAVEWRGFDPQAIADRIPENAQAVERQLQRITITDGQDHFAAEQMSTGGEALRFDPAYAVRMISDIAPNPFIGREIVGRLLSALGTRGFDETKIGSLASLVLEELRRGLDAERAARAETLFKAQVTAGRIQFRLRLDGKNWRMPLTIDTAEPDTARQLVGNTGGPLERSLFAPVYESEFNTDERAVAVYLDGEKALVWWHRNVARAQYGMQGWRRPKIYPDFIFAVQRADETRRITILETKGDQLDNLDTAYKTDVLDVLSMNFQWDTTVPAGTLELVKDTGETVECSLILMSEWPTKLPAHLAS